MPFEPADEYLIEDEETFELLADPTRLEILELCLAPRSVTEMAEAMKVPRTRLYHHVKLLEEAGVIVVVETRKSGAMTEKVYRAAADMYRPGEGFLKSAEPRAQAEALLGSVLGSTRADFVRAFDEGLASFRTEDNKQRTISLTRRLMTLTPENLHRLIDALEATLNEFDSDVDGDDEDLMVVGVLQIVHPSSRKPS